ncbi:MAG: isoleucine--tRNA ligase, partial [Syntrophales bacterium]|nr:isoleucine--tRNA ligase [Syntrophales bacterium]
RKNKIIGHSLDAAVTLAIPEGLETMLKERREDLRALLIVSRLDFANPEALPGAYESKEIEGLKVVVEKAKGRKCSRCWIYSEDLGVDPAHPDICGRCTANL